MSDSPYGSAFPPFAAATDDTLPVRSLRPAELDAALTALPPPHAAFARATAFAAKPGQVCLLPGPAGVESVLLGLGDDRAPWPHAALPPALPPGSTCRLEPGDFDPELATVGFLLGNYRFTRFKPAPAPAPRLLPPAASRNAPSTAAETAAAIFFARDLVNTPANLLGPAELADATLALAARFGADPRRTEGDALAREYPTVAAVGAGSARAPVVAAFTWRGSAAADDAPLLSLCGKGVCFDTGGYDLKPSAAMLRMKKDMGGAALLLGLAQAIMALDLPLRLAVRIGCVENAVSGTAMRPLDVLRTRRGITVEVGNTDAEGRLVLCDLLAEASDERPDILLDAATLTGAARVALGPDLPALFSNDDEIADAILAAGVATHDPLWRLPLHPGYDDWIVSQVADINNVSSKPHAGAITAALFLRRFIAENVRWVHLDTYAWNDQSRPGRPEGGEAQALRALLAAVTRWLHP